MGLVPAGTRIRGHYALESLANPAEELPRTRAKLARRKAAGVVISETFEQS